MEIDSLHAGLFSFLCCRQIFFFEKQNKTLTEKTNKNNKKETRAKTGILPVLNNLNPDQDRRFVGPDLDSNCLLRLPAGNTGKQGGLQLVV